jgi:hypothetical protein
LFSAITPVKSEVRTNGPGMKELDSSGRAIN